ncbi:hypothetical protein LEP3755_66080 (plasmid) [Leptolyngbya sp. NIES-3755]|nr:hypothetical protein LEP3755_66080 [Leptolyngbya sp. NIES-3755]
MMSNLYHNTAPGHYHGSHLRYLIEVRRLRLSDAIAGIKTDLLNQIHNLSAQQRTGLLSVIGFGFLGLPLLSTGAAIPILGTVVTVAIPAIWRTTLGGARKRLEIELSIVGHSAHFEDLLAAMSVYIDAHPNCGVSLNAFVNAYETALSNYQAVAYQDYNLDAMCQSFLASLRSQMGHTPVWFNHLVNQIDLEMKGRNVDLQHLQENPIGSVDPRIPTLPSWQMQLYGFTPTQGSAIESLRQQANTTSPESQPAILNSQQLSSSTQPNTRSNSTPLQSAKVENDPWNAEQTTIDIVNSDTAMKNPSPPVSTPKSPDLGINVAEKMASGRFVISRLIVGATRTGKSQLASDAAGLLRLRFGDKVTLFYISAGYIEEEDGRYWKMCDRAIGFYFPEMSDAEKRLAYDDWAQLLDEFNAIPSSVDRPKLLIVDELNSVMRSALGLNSEKAMQVFNAIKDKLASISSMGAKRGLAMWGIAPTGAMGDMELTRGNVTAMNPIFVAQRPDCDPGWNDVVYLTAKTNGMAPGKRPSEDVWDKARAIGIERVVGVGGQWLPLMNTLNICHQFSDVKFET